MRQVSENQSQNEKSAILICEKMNWSQKQMNVGAWLSTKWTVFAEGSVSRETKYDNCNFTNKKAHTSIYHTVLSEGDLNKLKLWLKDEFPLLSLHDGCDGVGWKIISFNENGDVIYDVAGLAPDDTALKTLLDIFN